MNSDTMPEDSELDLSQLPFRIGHVLVEPMKNQVRRQEEIVRVERQVMLLLIFLAQNSNRVVSRDLIHAELWPDAVRNDEALTQTMSKLRKALGDKPGDDRMIHTIRKVGYMLVGEIVLVDPTQAQDERRSNRRPRHDRPSRKKPRSKAVMMFLAAVTLVNCAAVVAGWVGSEDRPKGFRIVVAEGAPETVSQQFDMSSPADSLRLP